MKENKEYVTLNRFYSQWEMDEEDKSNFKKEFLIENDDVQLSSIFLEYTLFEVYDILRSYSNKARVNGADMCYKYLKKNFKFSKEDFSFRMPRTKRKEVEEDDTEIELNIQWM